MARIEDLSAFLDAYVETEQLPEPQKPWAIDSYILSIEWIGGLRNPELLTKIDLWSYTKWFNNETGGTVFDLQMGNGAEGWTKGLKSLEWLEGPLADGFLERVGLFHVTEDDKVELMASLSKITFLHKQLEGPTLFRSK